MTKKIDKLISQIDPQIKGFLDLRIEGRDDTPSPAQPSDPIGDAIFESEWGFRRCAPNVAPEKRPLTRSEIAQALANLSKTLGKPGFTSTAHLIQKLAQAAREHLGPDDPIRGFLEGYAAKDRTAMRTAVKKLVQASREEIIQHVKAGGHPLELLVRNEKDERPN